MRCPTPYGPFRPKPLSATWDRTRELAVIGRSQLDVHRRALLRNLVTDQPSNQVLDVRGLDLDPQTRCLHYHSPLDIIAIKMKCCGVYYACKDCHEALAGHAIVVWPRGEWDARAVLCGACGVEMTIRKYMESESRCPSCGAEPQGAPSAGHR